MSFVFAFPVIVSLELQGLGLMACLTGPGIAIGAVLVALPLVWFASRVRGKASTDIPPVQSMAERAALGASLAMWVYFLFAAVVQQLVEPMHLDWDDFSYHATMPAHWLQEQSFVLAPYNYHAFYPANAELFTLWFVGPTGVDSFHALAGLFWLCSCSVAIYGLCRELGSSASFGVAGATLVLVSAPHLHQAKGYSSTDLAASSLMCAGAYFCLRGSGTSSGRPPLVELGFAGALIGLAVGTKVTFGPPSVLALSFVLLGRPYWRSGGRVVLTFVGCALIAGGFWYIRNWLLTGNPFFPAAIAGFEGPLMRRREPQHRSG